MTEITREQIEELRELLTKATPGPWKWDGDVCDTSPDYRDQNAPWLVTADYLEIPILRGDIIGSQDADATLIAAMRNALPALLDIAEKVIAEPSDPKPTSDLLSRLASAQGEASAQRPAIEGSPSFEVGTTSEPPLTQISLKG